MDIKVYGGIKMRRKDVIEEDHDEDEDVYSGKGVECCCDDDEISTAEEAFMKGYLCS